MEDATPVKKYPLRRTSGRLLSKVSEQLTSSEASTKLRKKLNVNDDQSSSPCTAGLREHQGIAANETPVRGKRRNCSSHSKQLVSPLSKGTDEKKGVPCSNKPGERPKKLTPVSTIVIFPKDSVHPHDITILNRAKTDEDKNRGKSSVKFQMVEASGQVTPWSSKMQTRKIGQSKEEFNGSPSMNRVKRKLEDDEKVGNIDDEVSEGGGNSKRKKSMEEENTLQEDVIPEEVKQSWAEQISSTEFAQCGKCSQRRKSISYITKHYLSCKVGGTGGTPSGKTRRGTQRRCSTQGIVKRNLSENDKSDKDESTECNFEEKRKLWTDKIAENGFVNCDLCNQRHSRVFRMETHYLECLKQQEKKTQKMKKDKEDPKNTDDELKDTDDATDDYMTNAKKVWASQIASDGFAKCARCCQRRNHISSMEKHHKDCLAKTPAEVDYFCPHCQRHFQSSAGLKYHMMATHNDLMSPGAGSESSEADEGNENLVLRAILRKVGKIRCQVEDCNRSFSTFAGFVYHRQRCGVKNPKKYICDKCQKEYQSQPGLKAHMLAIHPPTPPPEDVTKLNDKNESEEAASQELTATGRVRRRAAVKAVDKVQQLVKNGTVLDSLDKTSFEEMVIDWSKPLYHKPVRPLVSSEMMVQWKETIKKKGRVSCPYAGCDATYTQAPSLKGHYKICSKSGLVLEDYKCSMCDKGYSTEYAVRGHIQTAHREAVLANQKAQESSNDEYSSLSSEDEDSSGSEFMEEDFGDDEDRKKPPVVRSSGSRSRELSKERFLPLPEATTWSIEQKKQFKDVTVFAEWQPLKSEWTLLNEMERKAYEPITMESIEFQREAESGRLSQKVKLKRYSSFALNSDEKVTTFFTGGPVWAANWCPLPLECTSANQYIAISCHRDYETTHTYDDLYSVKGMIQLWCFKILNKKRQYSLPYLSLGIAHEFGAIWDMKWCPSGAWEDVRQSGKEVSRLGLLALSCSDGTVRILSICHPECTDESFPVYKMKPSAVLKPTPTVSSQCKCLDWSPDINHRKIAAGFTDGLVVLWDLMTSSPLLKTSSGTSPECFYPYHSLRAHENYITDLNWCKHSETYMVTSGGDRYLKTWDLTATNEPVCTMLRGMVTQCCWPSHWSAVCIGQDNSVVGGQFPLGLHYVENGFFGAKRSYLAPLNSCVWSVSFSEWLNVVACGDSVGMVIAIVLSNMITKYSRHAKQPYGRFPIYYTNIEKISSRTSEEHETDCLNRKSNSINTLHTNVTGETNEINIVAMETDVLDEVNQNIKNEEIMGEQIHKEKNGENVAMETESESEKYRIKQLRNVGMESTSSVTQSSQISVRTTESCIKSESIEEIQDQEKTDDVTALLKSCANTKKSTDRLKPVENIDVGSRSTDTGSSSTKDTDIIPGNYSDLVKDYCLVYHDTDLRTFNDMKNRAPCKKTKFNKAYPKPDHYPIESINKVCWNPNFSVNQWILTAGHSGIVRVHYLDGMIDNAKDKKS